MNTATFCVELEKIFGQYKSKRKTRCQRILSGSKTMISSPYMNFLYEAGLYLKVYKRFRRGFRKNCRKSGLGTYTFIYYTYIYIYIFIIYIYLLYYIYIYYLFYLIIYLKLKNLQKYSIHIYIKVARQIG